MTLTVTTPGLTLRKSGVCIEADGADERRIIPAAEVSAVLLTCPCSITSELISLCAERDITVTMLDRIGTPLWHMNRLRGGSAPMIRRKQMALSGTAAGVELAKGLLRQKNANRVRFLKRLAKNRTAFMRATLKESVKSIEELTAKLEEIKGTAVKDVRPNLLGLEGASGRVYFQVLSEALPAGVGFQKRTFGSGADPFSQMLNYGYGVLYHRLASLCVQASLDPWIGILHTEDYNRPALVYDLIEPFRADVEETAFKLFSKVKTTYDRYLEPCENGRCLTAEAKRRLIGKLEDRMEGRNGERGREEDMRELAFGLARSLKKDSPPEECGESHVLSGVL